MRMGGSASQLAGHERPEQQEARDHEEDGDADVHALEHGLEPARKVLLHPRTGREVACTTSTIVMPKKRNASKQGKWSVLPDSKPAAPISGDGPSSREVMSPPGCGCLGVVRDLFVVLLFDVHRPDIVGRRRRCSRPRASR